MEGVGKLEVGHSVKVRERVTFREVRIVQFD